MKSIIINDHMDNDACKIIIQNNIFLHESCIQTHKVINSNMKEEERKAKRARERETIKSEQ